MRLFTGVPIPPPVLKNLREVLDRLRRIAPLKWSPPENLHITLKFIGEWPETRLPELQETLRAVPKPGKFTVEISRFGYLPNPHRPRNFFAGVHAGPELPALAQAVDDGLVNIGCPRENRPYTPHLTLARVKDEDIRSLREHIAAMKNLEFGSFDVTEFHLYLSKPGPRGSEYFILASYPLDPVTAE